MNRTAFAIPALLLALTGCTTTQAGPPAAPTVSDACAAAIAELAAADIDTEDAAIAASATACPTVDEYIAAVKDNPAAWLKSTAAEVEESADLIIVSVCLVDRTTPLCQSDDANAIVEANGGYPDE